MKYSFTPRGVCSAQIDFEIDDGIIKNVQFTRGCNGNTQGVGALCEGMRADEVVKRLEGINCSGRGTSCPDQLAKAVKMAMEQES
ncbi:MAG: TIGR03905 family TSCPD domain-containing protein [Clostridia bacterium]|nr:TIGR03905 family TSCPD domain-containing protein [Clostridia bacterium]